MMTEELLVDGVGLDGADGDGDGVDTGPFTNKVMTQARAALVHLSEQVKATCLCPVLLNP